MPNLPTGTVTFLFSDIEGSTRLTVDHASEWPAILARHQQLLRQVFTSEHGVEVGTEGDSFFAAFDAAPRAVAAAVAAQRALAAEAWPSGVAVRVRMGMHTGEAGFATDTYAGLHVHRASRVAGLAHGGQVLLSDATRVLVRDALPDGVTLRDLGPHRLKDLEQPERLWQAVIPGLQDAFPPLASPAVTPNNLPRHLTTFLGREREIDEVRHLLRGSRLLTLTGPGGTGKTRLSLQVAARVLGDYPDGVFFVELAPISQPELVIGTIAQQLGLADRGGRTAMERVTEHVAARRMLLVLDNFEQVIAAAPEIAELLAAAPELFVLVTSRSVLRVSGEQEYAVPPLALPDPARLPSLTKLSQYEAVALFIERARAVKPGFEVTNENAPAIAEICVRLDGLPLALELAAARIRVFMPQAMLPRLEHRLALLEGGGRDLPARQRTLRGAIGWSHDMLDETERALFACLSVCVGGGSMAAVERLCEGELPEGSLDPLISLVEQSLVRQAAGVDGEPRFTMLETIREYAVEQAVARGAWERLRDRHAGIFGDLAAASVVNVMGPSKRAWLDRLEEEHDNLRAAIAWATQRGEASFALRLCSSLWRFWQMRGHIAEGLERTSEALAMPGAGEPTAARADALSAAAGLAYWQADAARSRAFYLEEIQVRRELGDRAGLAEALYGISFTWFIIDLNAPDAHEQARHYVTQALHIYAELGDAPGIGRCESALGALAWQMKDFETARTHALRARDVFASIDDQFNLGWASYTLGLAGVSQAATSPAGGEVEEARQRFTEALRIFDEAQDVSGYAIVLDGFAVLALVEGDSERAARLSGAVSVLERTSGTGLNYWNRDGLNFDPQRLRSDPALAAAWAEGEALSASEAVAVALEPPRR